MKLSCKKLYVSFRNCE